MSNTFVEFLIEGTIAYGLRDRSENPAEAYVPRAVAELERIARTGGEAGILLPTAPEF